MILSTPETIRAYTRAGWWGTTTLLDLWEANVAAHPERTALVDPPNRADFTVGSPQRWTYAQADARATRLAAALRDAGVGRDDVVMVQLPNVVELALVYLAALRLGAIVSPLPVQYRQHELRHTMGVVEPRAFVTATRCGGFDHVAMVRALRGEVPSLSVVLALAEDGETLPADVLPLRDILEADGALPAFPGPSPSWDANEISTICWTSGTEAEPKGVPRSHNMWLSIACGTTDGARLDDGAVMLNPFPLVNMSGIGGMLVPWLQVAGTLVMHHPMSLPVFLAQVGTERAEYTVAPPILLNMLLANEALLASADLSSMRVIGSGSAPLSAFMVSGWKNRFGIEVLNFFGSNEGIALVGDPATVPDPAERARYFPRFGASDSDDAAWGNRAALGMETRLVDPVSGEPVTAPDEPGELVFRGPTLFPGYYRRPEMTARAFDADGFYRTGDLFEIRARAPGPPALRGPGPRPHHPRRHEGRTGGAGDAHREPPRGRRCGRGGHRGPAAAGRAADLRRGRPPSGDVADHGRAALAPRRAADRGLQDAQGPAGGRRPAAQPGGQGAQARPAHAPRGARRRAIGGGGSGGRGRHGLIRGRHRP